MGRNNCNRFNSPCGDYRRNVPPPLSAGYIFSLLFSIAAASANILFAWLLTGRNFFYHSIF